MRDVMGDHNAVEELESEWEKLVEDRNALRHTFPNGNSRVVLPCNLQRLIWNAQKIFRINVRKPTDLHPVKIVEGVRNLEKKFMICKGSDRLSVQANRNATLLMNCLVRSVLCSKQVIEQHRLSGEAFDWILGEIESRFQQAMVCKTLHNNVPESVIIMFHHHLIVLVCAVLGSSG